jgi:prepilin-type N-terminal cleavage/methylation domain-containing protein
MILKTNFAARRAHRPEEGFTMIEIVLSLAVIAVAMVAIIGVLPLGMNVQSENRETSVINTDAGIWIEALRSGAQGMGYLTNYVQEVRVREIRRNAANGSFISESTEYVNTFAGASNLIGILSYPKYRIDPNDSTVAIERNVYADVRALNGNMGDLIADDDFSFNYRLTPEFVSKEPFSGAGHQAFMRRNLYELKLNFAWPLVVGTGGDYRDQTKFFKDITFRTLVSGNLVSFENPDDVNKPFLFVNPRQYGNNQQ